MKELQLIANGIDKATQKGCFTLDECAMLIDALKKLKDLLPVEDSKTDGKSE